MIKFMYFLGCYQSFILSAMQHKTKCVTVVARAYEFSRWAIDFVRFALFYIVIDSLIFE